MSGQQNYNNISSSGNSGQISIGSDNIQNWSVNETHPTEKQLTLQDVVDLLEEIKAHLRNEDLPQKEEAMLYLQAAKVQAQKEEPDKKLVAGNLKQVAEIIENANKAADSGKGLWEKVLPLLTRLAPWLGAAKSLLGLPPL